MFSRPSRRRRIHPTRRTRLQAVTAVLAVTLAGCGSSSDSTPVTDNPSLSGTPVKVGIIYTAGTPVLDVTAIPAAVRAAVRAVNTRNGFGGRPVELVECNDGADQNKSASCARKMKSEGVVATFSDLSAGNPDTVATILDQEGIPQVGLLATSELQFTCGTCFPIGAGSSIGYTAGSTTALAGSGAKSLYIIGVALPGLSEISEVYAAKAATAKGLTVAGYTGIAANVTDLAPIAAKVAASGADSVFTYVLPGQTVALTRALSDAGFRGQITVPPGLTPKDLTQLAGGNTVVSWNTTPPATATTIPAIADFTRDLAAQAATGDKYADLGAMDAFAPGAWLQVLMLERLTAGLSEISAATVLEALTAQTSPLDMQGFGPGWTPGTPTDLPAPLTRIGNVTQGWPMTVKDGTYVLDGTTTSDVRDVLAVMLG